MVKQVIVMRTDLGMRRGKQIAQGCHASLAVITNQFINTPMQIGADRFKARYIRPDKAMEEWLDGKFTKICVRVDSEEKLHEIYNKAKDRGLPCSLILDAGDTEFHGVPTYTCVGIGPADAEKIDKITGGLKLL